MATMLELCERVHEEEEPIEAVLGKLAYDGDLCDLYSAERFVFKITRSISDNDLIEHEAMILRQLYPENQADEKFFRYLPKLRATFKVTKTLRHVNVFDHFEGYLSFEEILRAYPMGIDFRDVVWMYKRLLAGIGFPHTQRIVHGAILPSHVLVHPTGHGAKIIDWSYSVDLSKPVPKPNMWDRIAEEEPVQHHYVKAISKLYEAYYAPEILKKEAPTPAADLYMAAKCALALLGGDVKTNKMPDAVPSPVQEFFGYSLVEDPKRRAQDAWRLHEDFDKLLLRVVGEPQYRPFTMPAKPTP